MLQIVDAHEVGIGSGVGVELDLRMVPDGRAKGVRLATLIASRL
jgi:hypothetical protein